MSVDIKTLERPTKSRESFSELQRTSKGVSPQKVFTGTLTNPIVAFSPLALCGCSQRFIPKKRQAFLLEATLVLLLKL